MYIILLEFNCKGLLAAQVQPLQLLQLLQHELGYQCFETQSEQIHLSGARTVGSMALSLEEFARKYSKPGGGFGRWTDLVCTKFSLL